MKQLVKKESVDGESVYEAELIPEDEGNGSVERAPAAETNPGFTQKIARAAGILLAGFEIFMKTKDILADKISGTKSDQKGGGKRARRNRRGR